MKKFLSFLLILSIIGCSKYETVNKSGIQLNYIYSTAPESRKIFNYDNLDRLNQVKEVVIPLETWDIRYKKNKVSRIDVTNSIQSSVDSFVYNEDSGLLEKTLLYLHLGFPQQPTRRRTVEFEYNKRDKVIEKRSYDKDGVQYSTEHFEWKGDNIKYYKYYSFENIEIESTYFYDNKCNYKKDYPIYLTDPINWTANNIVRIESIIHNSLIETCNPCEIEYKYNKDGYPVEISHNGGAPYILQFE